MNEKPEPSAHHPAVHWLNALRPWNLIIVIYPCSLGIVLGSAGSRGSRLNTTLLLIAAVLMQSGANMLGEFFQFGTPAGRRPRPQSVFGTGRTRIDWLIFLSGIACFFLAIPFGMILVYRSGVPILLLGLVGFAAGYFYMGEPIHYKRRGLGAPAAFIFLGFLTVAGAAYAVSGRIPDHTILISVPAGLLAAALLLKNEILDIEADGESGARTLAVRAGRMPSVALLAGLLLLAYVWPALIGLLPSNSRPGGQIWIVCAALPFAVASVRGSMPWMLVHHYLYGALYVFAFAASAGR